MAALMHSSKLAVALRPFFLRHFILLRFENTSWRIAGSITLVAPDMALALRSPMRYRCVCARSLRRAAGLVGVWRSIVFTQSGNWGRARGRSYIESISLPAVLTSQGWLMDRSTYVRAYV